MKIDVRCFATLANADACDYKQATVYELNEGQTVADLAASAGITDENIKITFLNGRQVDGDTVLAHGDRVGFVPPVGGM